MNVEQAQVPGSGQGMAADALAALAGTAGLAALGPIMDLLPVGIYVLGGGSPEELVVLAENSAAAAIHGATIPPGSAPYSMPYALYGPDRREPLPPESLPAYRVVASGGAVANQEIHVLRPDGEWRVLLANAAPVHMGGRVAGAVLAFQDVTEGKRVEEALRESEARFRALADSNIIGVAFADPVSGAVWDANDEYLRIIGRTRAELQAGTLNWKAITPPETVEGEERRADHPPPDGRGRPYEKEYVRPDGTRVPVIIGGAYLAPRQVVAFVLDNSERRQVQEALRESEERFRTFTRQSRDGIIMVDSAGRIVEWNEGEEALTGISRSEALGRPLWEVQFRLAPGERRTATFAAAARKVIVKGLKEGIHLRRLIEEEIERPDGSRRFVQSRIFAIQSGREILACAICRDITARKQMEDALRESEEQLRLFVAHTPAAVAMFDTEMRYLLASRRWLADYHLGERDIIGRSHYEVFPEIPERWKEIHRRCLAGAVERAEADPFPRADGRTDWVRWEIHPWRKSSKAIGGLIVFSEVITTRIEAEVRTTTLREMAAALSAAATCEQIAAVVAGRALPGVGAESGGIYLLDEAGEALHLVGGAGTPPEWADAARRLPLSAATLTTAVVRTGKAVWVENGNEIPALFPDSPALHPSGAARAAIPLVVDGRVLGALSFLFAAPRRFSEGQRVLMREIAGLAAQALERARLLEAEQAARTDAQRAAARAAALQAATAALSAALTPADVSRAVLEQAACVTGAKSGAVALLTGDSEMELAASVGYPAETVAAFRRFARDARVPTADAVRSGHPLLFCTAAEFEAAYPRRDGSAPPFAALVAFPIRIDGRDLGAMCLSFAEARTFDAAEQAFLEAVAAQTAQALERARLYEAERRAQAQLRDADRRKDEFLAMLAHELRNPLAAIAAAAHLMETPGANQEMLAHARKAAVRQAQHMSRLVDDLLDVSRITQGKVTLKQEHVAIADVIDSAAEGARPGIEGAGHRLYVSRPHEALTVVGDPVRLAQVVGNLLDNAAKYTPPGGEIHLSVERVASDATRSTVEIRVRDNGIGIAPELLPHIFDLFVQGERGVDRNQGGLGIGLTMVKRLVEVHGGRVWAESAGPGQGSGFIVRLPLAEVRSAEGEGRSAPASAPRRILVVDDSADGAQLMADILELNGHEVLAANSGPAALALAGEYHPDIVLLDIGMPGMDGYEVARRLRQDPALAGMVLVAITGYGGEEDRERSREAGFDHHLVKPVEPVDLLRLAAEAPRRG